jgi:CDP-diacylglycerol--glycerol-3-phosphate 3-phosphatidyltransferase
MSTLFATATVPSMYRLKAAFQAWLRPLIRVVAELGVTANQITLTACALSVGFGLLLISQPQSRALLLLLPVLLFLRMALNAMDGLLAREFGQQSKLGACLNELGDVVSDAFLYIPFVYLGNLDSLWMLVVILLAVISEMAGVVTVMIGASRRYDGPMGKSDRALVFGALALWFGLGGRVAPSVSYLFPRLMTLLLIATVVNRVRAGLLETTGGIDG